MNCPPMSSPIPIVIRGNMAFWLISSCVSVSPNVSIIEAVINSTIIPDEKDRVNADHRHYGASLIIA